MDMSKMRVDSVVRMATSVMPMRLCWSWFYAGQIMALLAFPVLAAHYGEPWPRPKNEISLSNASSLNIIDLQPQDLDWDSQRIHHVMHRLMSSKEDDFDSAVTKRSLKGSAVRHETQSLISNFLAKYGGKLNGTFELEGRNTAVRVVIHQNANNFKVISVKQPLIEKFVFNSWKKRGGK